MEIISKHLAELQVRNSLEIPIMPTASTSWILGNNETIEGTLEEKPNVDYSTPTVAIENSSKNFCNFE